MQDCYNKMLFSLQGDCYMLITHLPKTQLLNILPFKTQCFMFNLCILSKSRFLHILDCKRDKGYGQTLPQSKVK